MAVVEEFCLAAKDKWPDCLIQFEDFQTDKAFAILERFREKFLCFNGALSGSCTAFCTRSLPLQSYILDLLPALMLALH